MKPHWQVRTPAGVLLTDVAPVDHPWHEGLAVAIPSVTADGRTSNCWGGGTYVPGRGYQDLGDHGSWVERDGGRIDWLAADGASVLTERRTLECAPVGAAVPAGRGGPIGQDGAAGPAGPVGVGGPIGRVGSVGRVESVGPIGRVGSVGSVGLLGPAWRLRLRSVLRPVAWTVTLGSPGSAGRDGAGYGGWFWRFPLCADVEVRAAGGLDGEAAVHGAVADWVCWSATFPDGPATVLLAGADAATRADPWFVRVAEYPAIGSAVAWSSPTVVPAEGLRRGLDGIVADGRHRPEELLALL